MTVVIDSNVFVSSISSFSPFHDLFKAFLSGKFKTAVFTDIVLEYMEVFQRKFGQEKAATFYSLIIECPFIVNTNVYYNWGLMRADPDDNKFVDCAIAANADYIITNDSHFNVLKQIRFPHVKTISIEDFTKLLKAL